MKKIKKRIKETKYSKGVTTTEFETFNEHGNVVRVVSSLGYEFENIYDEDQKLINSFYIKDGKIDKRRCHNEYDKRGNLTLTRSKDEMKIFIYDDKNRIVRCDNISYKNSISTYYQYTNDNKIVIMKDVNFTKIEFYNDDKQIVRRIIISQNYINLNEVSFKYDKNGNLIHSIDSNGEEEFYKYDEYNNIIYYIRKDSEMIYEESTYEYEFYEDEK